MKTIKGTIDCEGIKRCYVGGAIAKIKCPGCGKELEKDLGEEYLSYPEVGIEDTLSFYCEPCGENITDNPPCDFEVKMKVISVILTLEYDPDNVTKG